MNFAERGTLLRTTSKVALVLGFVIIMGFASAPAAFAKSPPKNPFVGVWSATDVSFDNSQEWMVIAGSQNSGYTLIYYDTAAGSVCGYAPSGQGYGVIIVSHGTSSGNVLTATAIGPARCLNPQHTLWTVTFGMGVTYDPSTGTLYGVFSTWYRV